MIRLTTPITEDQARQLKVGDEVLLNGKVVLSRDIGHKFMKEQKPEDVVAMAAEYNIHFLPPPPGA